MKILSGLSSALLLAALLVVGGIPVWPQNLPPFHQTSEHRPIVPQCFNCHMGHKAPGIQGLKARVADTVCANCHSAKNLSNWKIRERFNGTYVPQPNTPTTTIIPGFNSGQPAPQGFPYQGKMGR